MEQIIVNAELTFDDWSAYQRAAQQRASQRTGRSAIIWAFFWCLATIATLAALDWFDVEFSMASFLGGYFVLFAVMLLSRRRSLKQFAPRANGVFLGHCTYTLDSHGLSTQRGSMGSQFGWSDIFAISTDDTHLYFWVDSTAAITLPVRALPHDLPLPVLQQQIAQWHPASETHSLSATSTDTTPTKTKPHWLRTLCNLWLLRRVAAEAVPVSAAPIALISCLSLILLVTLDRYGAGSQSEFYAHNIPVIGLYVLVTVVIAWILSRESFPATRFVQTLFVVTGSTLLLIAALHAISTLTRYPYTLASYVALGVYLLWYTANALRCLSNARQPRAVTAALFVTALFVIANAANFWTPKLWYPLEDETASAEFDQTWNDGESLLFAQQQRIDRALDSIVPTADATTDSTPVTYFLGFAGVAEQKVFAEEIRLANQVVNDRYHTGARSLRLVNDRRDLQSLPLATVTNLHYALQGLAKKMNVDQDVLFLALSSHGADEPSLQVSNGYLSLQQVTGDNLTQALNDAGIKWRVIVISACHAGSFIEPLKDPRTIIITAAAADKTSFGCADDRDLTYFGEAFYRDALPKASTLQQAFTQAKAAITARERQEKIKASDPQAYFGAEITRKLQAAN